MTTTEGETVRRLLTGNEAVARGAWEAGAIFATAYPGTPSTEILETLAGYDDIRVEWAPNEKVAYEVAYGVAVGGGRTLVAMKHVGVNVAADPVFSSSYSGANGGLVLVSADDPAMHSSQNEQDNRNLARAAKLPVLEPSDSGEARDFVLLAFELSERFDTPVMLRLTTRICHSTTPVELDPEAIYRPAPRRGFRRDPSKYVLLPAHARERHEVVEARQEELSAYGDGEEAPNREEWRGEGPGPHLGVITAGIAYQYVREALPGASVLKLGLTNPLPRERIRRFAAAVDRLHVVEELDPVLEEQVRALGLEVTGKEVLPRTGELGPEAVARAFGVSLDAKGVGEADIPLPPRPPVMCPGCSHRGVFHVLGKRGLTVAGDIGCYTLGALSPLEAMDTCLSMGAGVGMARGMRIALEGNADAPEVVAVIGDSTFIHSGITGLVDLVYNRGRGVVIVLDNGTTAMTGHQEHPATGRTLSGEETHRLDLEGLCRAAGVRRVRVVDPWKIEEIDAALDEELAAAEPSVIIARGPCVLARGDPLGPPAVIDAELCAVCGLCGELGCPAILDPRTEPRIDTLLCPGCGLCVELCPFDAISLREAGEERTG